VTTRLLLVDARVPTPNRDGGSRRMCHIVRLLGELGVAVSFAASHPRSFPPFDDSLAEDTARLRELGVDLPPEGTTVGEHLARHGHRYDVVLMTGAFVAARHEADVRRLAPQAAVVFDTIDLHFLREYRAARLTGSVPRLQGALRLKRVELALARRADVTMVVSDRERRVLEREEPRIQARVVSSAYAPVPAPGPDGRRDLLYLGAFTFDPNVDAVTSFVDEVLPALRDRLPGVVLHVVGADPTPAIRRLHGDGVNVTGFVPDLTGHFDRSRVFVAPLRFGAGVKNKLVLSLAHGLPAVASPIAVEGIPARDGADLLVAHDTPEWIARVAGLYEDRALWQTLAANGQALVAAEYSLAVVGRQLEAVLALAASRGRVRSAAS
jgi:glycosyltransferase involved in cell wall biosynthesis